MYSLLYCGEACAADHVMHYAEGFPALLSLVVTTPSVGIAHAHGLRRWVEYENNMDDVVDVFI